MGESENNQLSMKTELLCGLAYSRRMNIPRKSAHFPHCSSQRGKFINVFICWSVTICCQKVMWKLKEKMWVWDGGVGCGCGMGVDVNVFQSGCFYL